MKVPGYRNQQRFTHGFTLIELLVVIAVIGILAAVVLASLNSARSKAKVAAIKSNLRTAVSQGELYFYNNGNTYANICDSATGNANDAVIQNAITAIRNTGAEARCYVHSGTFRVVDWGIGVLYDTNKMYVASPQGALTLDNANTGTTFTWDAAIAECASAGKKLPTISSLKALWDIRSNTGVDGLFSAAYYWQSIEAINDPAIAYLITMDTGVLTSTAKTSLRPIRCGI